MLKEVTDKLQDGNVSNSGGDNSSDEYSSDNDDKNSDNGSVDSDEKRRINLTKNLEITSM
jgi:hypothetical protein